MSDSKSLDLPEELIEFWYNYQELFVKISNLLDDHPDAYQLFLEKFRIVHHQMIDLNQQMETLLTDYDQNLTTSELSPAEEDRLDQLNERNRIFQQIKPFITLASLFPNSLDHLPPLDKLGYSSPNLFGSAYVTNNQSEEDRN